jgi:hypothetical protein
VQGNQGKEKKKIYIYIFGTEKGLEFQKLDISLFRDGKTNHEFL